MSFMMELFLGLTFCALLLLLAPGFACNSVSALALTGNWHIHHVRTDNERTERIEATSRLGFKMPLFCFDSSRR